MDSSTSDLNYSYHEKLNFYPVAVGAVRQIASDTIVLEQVAADGIPRTRAGVIHD